MKKKKLAIIGANDFQNQLILKAKSLGYETHVFAWRDGAVGEKTADFFYPISVLEKDEILEKCREIQIDGICSVASELAAITVNYVAENLGLIGNQVKYTDIQTNKYAMRTALSAAGIKCPKFVLADEELDCEKALSDFKFPVIVKPTDRSGSRNIMKLDSIEGVKEAVADACAVAFEKKAIIEEYVTGDEYSMESITYNGRHHFLAVTKKYTTGEPHFIETAHRQPSGLSEEVIERVKNVIFSALDVLHVENSAGHAEFRIDDDGNVIIIEIGARMGGGCIGSDLVYLSTGNDFLKMVIDVAYGNPPELVDVPTQRDVEVKFLFDQEDLDELMNLQKSNPDIIYRVSELELQNMGNITDNSNRIGYYILFKR